jgi:methylated-DNA-protein-cysteine methyltransferase-like protein
MVGWALKHSSTCEEFVPAHRVVNRLGRLTGKHRFPGGETMKELLESEGIEVVDDQIQNFDQVFWDPGKELDLEVI